MAGNIKGITIQFNGDTTQLDKALREINDKTRSLDKELKQVNNALKFNPTNVELWRQKQELLTQKVGETKSKLDALKQAQAQMDTSGVDKNSKEYRELERQIIVTENQVKNFEGQLRQIGNVKLKALSEEFQQVGGKIETVGQSLKGVSIAAAGVVGGLGVMSYKAATAADDLNTLSKVTGIGTKDLQKYSYAADLVDVSVDAVAKSNTKLKKQMFSARDGGASAEAFEELGVAVTNADGSLRNSEDVFQDVLKSLGSMKNETERDALAMTLMGKSASELNPLIENGGETYKMVADTMKKYNLDYVDQETLDKANEFNDSIDTMKLLGSVAFAQVGSQLAAYLAPALEKVVDLVGRFADWLSKLSPETLTVIAAVAGLVAVLAPLLITIGKVATGIGAIIKVVNLLGGGIGLLSSGSLLPIIAVIGAVVAAGVLLYKNWDKIKAVAQALGDKLKAVWNSIKTAITGTWNSIKTATTTAWNAIKTAVTTPFTKAKETIVTLVDKVKSKISTAWDNIKSKTEKAWDSITEKIFTPFNWVKEKIEGFVDTIKGFFPIDLGAIFDAIKLPHLSVEWTELTALGKTVKFPSGFDVDWYANGGIFNSPTIAGLGEIPGGEAVVPLNKFWDKLDNMQGGDITINVYASPGMDVNQLAQKVEQRLVQLQKQRTKAYGTI